MHPHNGALSLKLKFTDEAGVDQIISPPISGNDGLGVQDNFLIEKSFLRIGCLYRIFRAYWIITITKSVLRIHQSNPPILTKLSSILNCHGPSGLLPLPGAAQHDSSRS